MKKSEYINEVLSYIQGKAYLNEIKTELENHIEDREEYYSNMGYDSEIAEQKAVDHMGSADEIGEEMNMLYNYKKHKIISIAGLNILIIYLLFQWLIISIFGRTFSYISYNIALTLIILCIIYRCTLYSRGKVVMLLQGIISFGMFFTMAYDSLFTPYIGVEAITFFIHGVICLTCSAEINSAIKGKQNSKVMKRYKIWGKIFLALAIICTLLSVTGFII